MGNIVSLTVSVAVDYLGGSLSAMLWEYIFQPYNATANKFYNIGMGLLQMAATIGSCTLLTSFLTPAGYSKDSTIGLIGVILFAFSYSPNMRAKLQTGHTTLREILLFNTGGFLDSKVKPYVKLHPEAAKVDTTNSGNGLPIPPGL